MLSHLLEQKNLCLVWLGLVFAFYPVGVLRGLEQTESQTQAPGQSLRLEELQEMRFTPWEAVTAVVWSPDGAVLAVSAGSSLYLYQSTDWRLLRRMEIGALTHELAFSPDGKWLAAGSRDGSLRLWEMKDLLGDQVSPPVQILPAHRKGVNAVSFSPDGRLLASGGNDAVARFWDFASGELVGMTIGGTFAVPSLAFSPDGKALAVVNGQLIRLREVGSERIIGTFRSDAPLYDVAFSPDGALIAASANNNLIRVWETAQAYRSANPVYPEPRLLSGHTGAAGTFRALVWKVVFSPDGRWLSSAGGDGTIRLWDPLSGQLLSTCAAHRLGTAGLAFRSDGGVLASGGLEGSIKIWRVVEGSADQSSSCEK